MCFWNYVQDKTSWIYCSRVKQWEVVICSCTCFSYNYFKKHCKQWSGWCTTPFCDPCTVVFTLTRNICREQFAFQRTRSSVNTALYLRCWIETLLCGQVGHSLNKNVLCVVVILVDDIINVITIVNGWTENPGFCSVCMCANKITRLFSTTVWLVFKESTICPPGATVAQWLRCCATNRKVAGSVPAGVSGVFIDVKSFQSHYGPGVDSASNRNEYQEYFLGVKAAGA